MQPDPNDPAEEGLAGERPPSTELPDWDVHAGPDATLGGYIREHNRPPGFEGSDGQPYTVSLEVEKTPNLRAPFEGYLVFPRWAATGLGVLEHLETPTLLTGTSKEEVLEQLGQIPLLRVKVLLDEAVLRKADDQ